MNWDRLKLRFDVCTFGGLFGYYSHFHAFSLCCFSKVTKYLGCGTSPPHRFTQTAILIVYLWFFFTEFIVASESLWRIISQSMTLFPPCSIHLPSCFEIRKCPLLTQGEQSPTCQCPIPGTYRMYFSKSCSHSLRNILKNPVSPW